MDNLIVEEPAEDLTPVPAPERPLVVEVPTPEPAEPIDQVKPLVVGYHSPRAYKGGHINCTIVHSEYGEIPFTYDPSDTSQASLELGLLLLADKVKYSELEECPLVALQVGMEERSWRGAELNIADIELLKAEDADPDSVGTPTQWRQYRVALRNWPESEFFPDSAKRPVRPK